MKSLPGAGSYLVPAWSRGKNFLSSPGPGPGALLSSPGLSISAWNPGVPAQGFGAENKGTEALSFRQVYGCFFSLPTSRRIKGVCGNDGVKRVVCRLRWEFFVCTVFG